MLEKILELSYTDPFVYQCIMRWRCGDITYQEAMEICVLELARHSELLQNRLETILVNSAIPLNLKEILE